MLVVVVASPPRRNTEVEDGKKREGVPVIAIAMVALVVLVLVVILAIVVEVLVLLRVQLVCVVIED